MPTIEELPNEARIREAIDDAESCLNEADDHLGSYEDDDTRPMRMELIASAQARGTIAIAYALEAIKTELRLGR